MEVAVTTNINVALYCRLSREDGDSLESSSIKSQKEILSEYAKGKNWNVYNTYVDDGFSGGNFNRPAFKRLLADIENGNINVILTKDLSRLGRNYIQTGYYTEEYFPEHNIRYIAVNDNYDSTDENNDFTPFKNIINQWYLKDISKKVRAVNDLRMRKGLLRKGGIPLFGYLQNDKQERIINEETASTVRLIFRLYLNDLSYKEIAKYLYDNKIINPEFYAYITFDYNPKIWLDAHEDKKYIWSKGVINKILIEQQYTGDLILKKKKTVSYKTHKRVRSKKEEQLVFENKFQPIISKEEFALVKNKMRTRTKDAIPLDINPYKDFIFCGCCGHALSLNRRKAYPEHRMKAQNTYLCRNKEPCENRTRINYEVVDDVVRKELSNLIKVLLTHENEIKTYAKNYLAKGNKMSETDNKTLVNLSTRNAKLEILIQKLFEKNALGDITNDTYQKMNEGYKNEFIKNKEEIRRINELYEEKTKKDYAYLTEDFYNNLKETKDNENIREILAAVVYKILVFKKDKGYKFKFIFQNIPDMLEDYFKWKKM